MQENNDHWILKDKISQKYSNSENISQNHCSKLILIVAIKYYTWCNIETTIWNLMLWTIKSICIVRLSFSLHNFYFHPRLVRVMIVIKLRSATFIHFTHKKMSLFYLILFFIWFSLWYVSMRNHIDDTLETSSWG